MQEQSQCKCNQSRQVSLTDLSFNYQISAVTQVTPAEFRAETLKQPQDLESKPSTRAPQPPCPSFDALQAILLSPTRGGRHVEIAIYQKVTIFYARQLHGHKPRSIPQPHNEGYNWKSDFITTEKTHQHLAGAAEFPPTTVALLEYQPPSKCNLAICNPLPN